MKRTIGLILCVVMLIAMIPIAHAATIIDSGSCGADVTYTLDSDGLLTISGTGPMDDYFDNAPWYSHSTYGVNNERVGRIVIESGVTRIGDCAFEYCDSALSVSIPETVQEIGEDAFFECDSLTKIVIPDSVSYIDSYAFSDCDALRSITLPNNPDFTAIASNSFSCCINLSSIVIPDSVTAINEKAFDCCTKLTSVTFPKGLNSIGHNAFDDCLSLRNVTLPSTLTTIEYESFINCDALTSITIPGTVRTIGNRAFCSCNNLVSVVASPGVWYIGQESFENCNQLTDVSIPDTIRKIGSYAFYGCSKLKSLTLPESVINIESAASIPSGCTIYGYADSYAQEWAAANNRTFVVIDEPAAPPAVPTNVKATATAPNTITVSWDAVAGATQYNIYRYNASKSAYVYKGTTFASAAKPTQYVDGSLTAGTTYYYKVVAVDKSTAQTLVGEYSAAVHATAYAAPTVAVPTGVAVNATGDRQLTVSWNAVANATQYNVYRYRGSDQKYHYLGTTFASAAKPTQYMDTGLSVGTTYYYKVVAVYKDADQTVVSDKSAAANAKVISITAPALPEELTVRSTMKGSAVLLWDVVDGATQYNIYRYNGTKKAYVYIGTSYSDIYRVSGLSSGTTYYFKIVSVYKDADVTLTSAKSAAVSVKIK